MSDPYAAIVRYYDAENADLVDDLPAYLLLAERFGDPVLDVGCGTGRVAFSLAQNGFTVTGIDPSPAMMQKAFMRTEQFPALAGKLSWEQIDITGLPTAKNFSLAIFAYNGFMHLAEPEHQIAGLKAIAAHLKSGGGLVIDLPNPVDIVRTDDMPGLVVERTFDDPLTGQPVMQSSLVEVDRASQRMSVTWIYDRIGEGGVLHRTVAPLEMRYVMSREIHLLLERSGFEAVELYGTYTFDDYKEESPRLFVVATRV